MQTGNAKISVYTLNKRVNTTNLINSQWRRVQQYNGNYNFLLTQTTKAIHNVLFNQQRVVREMRTGNARNSIKKARNRVMRENLVMNKNKHKHT